MSVKSFLKDIIYGNRLTAVIRISLGILLLFSGFFKAIDLESFAATIAQYNIIPVATVPYVAIMLPFLELIIGQLLLTGYKTRAASFIGIVLMLLFSVFIAVNVWRGETFNCGCFELQRLGLGIDESVSVKLVIRDVILAFLFAVVCMAKRHVFSFEGYLERKSLEEI